jgi:hypothetical protein
MPKAPLALTPAQRAQIFDEGRQAAIAKRSPFTYPYIDDKNDDRYLCWTDGYRSIAG